MKSKKNYQIRFILTIIFLLIILIFFSIYNIIFVAKNLGNLFNLEKKSEEFLIKFRVEEFERLNLVN